MYIDRVVIQDIKGFRSLDLEMKRPDHSYAGWTVLAGRNGAGKSTLLQAIALAIAGPDVARSLRESFAGWIRRGSQFGDGFVDKGKLPKASFWIPLHWELPETGSEPRFSKSLRIDTESMTSKQWAKYQN